MKVALVYDRVNKIGGAERVLLALHEIWPEAPLYTSVYNPETAPWAKDFQIIPSFLQKIPFAKTHHEFFPWLTPLAFESFDFTPPAGGFDVVISITSAEAKAIITGPNTMHLCYCLTPTRYLWSGYKDYKIPSIFKPLVSGLRIWDQIACQRPDEYLAISKTVQQRIRKYYRRESEVIYPPIDLHKFQVPNTKSQIDFKFQTSNFKFFLIVSRLVPYKRIDLAVEAFNQLGWPLKIIGIGSEDYRLRKMAKSNIEFLGQLTDEEVLGYYKNCQAVIFPGEEDFGLVPLEAQACGKPVIAFRSGGATETIIEGKTGEFFYPQTSKALTKKLKNLKTEKYKTGDCQENVQRFNQEIFKKKFKLFVEEKWKNHLKNISTL